MTTDGAAGLTFEEHAAMVERMLRAVREHLGLEVAFVSQLVDHERVFRFVDSTMEACPVVVGGRDPEEESYCFHVVSGALPELLSDAAEHPFAVGIRATTTLPVGTHVSVPIRFSDGRVFGTFCVFSRSVAPGVDDGALRGVRMLAELAGEHLEAMDTEERRRRHEVEVVDAVLADRTGMAMHFQPLVELQGLRTVGVEALARFPGRGTTPARFFSLAAEHGRTLAAEVAAVHLALEALADLPTGLRLNVNVSPDTLVSAEFARAVERVGPGRLIVEVTEHAAIADYTDLRQASARLSARGIGLAIDDVGMGFSGLNRILETSPQEIKLDAGVVHGVDADPVRQAMIESLCTFARRVGLRTVAEGIETEAELRTVQRLGIDVVQGFHLARPAPLADALRARPLAAWPIEPREES